MDSREVRRLIEHYFHCRFQNQVRVDFHNNRHAVTMSLSTLKRLLCDYSLGRCGMDVSDHKVREIVQREISGSSELQGYRAVWHSLRVNHHIIVPRERVANILCELNPAKTRERRKRRLARRRYTSYGPHFSLSKETVCLVVLIASPGTFQFSEHDLEWPRTQGCWKLLPVFFIVFVVVNFLSQVIFIFPLFQLR